MAYTEVKLQTAIFGACGTKDAVWTNTYNNYIRRGTCYKMRRAGGGDTYDNYIRRGDVLRNETSRRRRHIR